MPLINLFLFASKKKKNNTRRCYAIIRLGLDGTFPRKPMQPTILSFSERITLPGESRSYRSGHAFIHSADTMYITPSSGSGKPSTGPNVDSNIGYPLKSATLRVLALTRATLPDGGIDTPVVTSVIVCAVRLINIIIS